MDTVRIFIIQSPGLFSLRASILAQQWYLAVGARFEPSFDDLLRVDSPSIPVFLSLFAGLGPTLDVCALQG